jgi:hypothetical protein
MFDGKAFGQEVVTAVKSHVDKAVGPLMKRIAELEQQIALIPAPAEIDPEIIKAMIADLLAAIPPAKDGKDADPVEVAETIKAEVERAVAAIPAPQDDKSVTVDDVRPLIEESVSKAVSALPVPKDGTPGKDGRDGLDSVEFLRSADNHLIVTLSNGTTRDLGEFVGKDGQPGKPGADGIGFDDLDLAETDDGIVLRFTRGEVVKEFPLPVVIDRGVFKEGQTYAKGNGVTWAGSFWIAQESTADKPDTGKGWRLAVKRGRDGRDGVVKAETKPVVKVG